MTQLAADFAAKGLLSLMMSSSMATGLAHSILIILFDQILTRRAIFRVIYTYPSWVFYMSWLVASDQFSPLL